MGYKGYGLSFFTIRMPSKPKLTFHSIRIPFFPFRSITWALFSNIFPLIIFRSPFPAVTALFITITIITSFRFFYAVFFSLCFFHFVDSGSTSGVVAWLLFSLKIRNVLLYDVISFSFDIAGKKSPLSVLNWNRLCVISIPFLVVFSNVCILTLILFACDASTLPAHERGTKCYSLSLGWDKCVTRSTSIWKQPNQRETAEKRRTRWNGMWKRRKKPNKTKRKTQNKGAQRSLLNYRFHHIAHTTNATNGRIG